MDKFVGRDTSHATVNATIAHLKFRAIPFCTMCLADRPTTNSVFLANWEGAVTSKKLGCIFINPYYYALSSS